MNNKYRLIDLFCGCGGISRGFEWTNRFSTEFGVELEPYPAKTFKNNLTNHNGESPEVFIGDIEELTKSKKSFWKELNKAGITKASEIDVLVGGPPCQGFSRNGVRFYDDPRNHLYKSFLFCLEELLPPLVLIENVREFLNFENGEFSKDLLLRLDEIGYEVQYQKLCVADYGVPQMRHRVFFVGTRKDVVKKAGRKAAIPERTHSPITRQLSFDEPYNTVRDAIGDLPKPVMLHALSPQEYNQNVKHISEYSKFLRRDSKKLYNHVARVLSKKSLERVNAVGTGRMKHISSELQTKKFYGSAYRRMAWDEPSLTITTWVYHVGSGPYAHPVEDRCVTMREAARIQSFDDAFVFPPVVNPVSQMIGNAVPPLMAYHFAKEFLNILDDYNTSELKNIRARDRSGLVRSTEAKRSRA